MWLLIHLNKALNFLDEIFSKYLHYFNTIYNTNIMIIHLIYYLKLVYLVCTRS